MDDFQHKKLLDKIKNLKAIVAKYPTKPLLYTIALEVRKGTSNAKLVSPFKQFFYLMGILLTTTEPSTPEVINKDELINLLNSIFNDQVLEFYPSEEDSGEISKEWFRNREVAMPTFLHYFNNVLLASVEQIIDRITEGIIPFDNEIENVLGITASQILNYAKQINEYQENKLKALLQLAAEGKKIRHELLDKALEDGWSLERLREEANTGEYSEFYSDYLNEIDDLYDIDCKDIPNYDEKFDLFIKLFSVKRDGNVSFDYMTEFNPVEVAPLVKISENNYLCPIINALFIAINQKLEQVLIESTAKQRFLKHRDILLEHKGTSMLLSLLGEKAIVYENLYETRDLQNEHDSIIISGKNIYILEAKASPPNEPFRDPDKAYIRIKRHFASDRGIQKGYEQAERVRKGIELNKGFELYNKKSELVLKLKQQDFHNVFCICLTRDDYGPLASNLNLLLEKEDNIPFPWVVNILDLEAIVQGFDLLNLRENKFVDYLKARIRLHGKLFGSDELEYVGYYLMHRNFNDIFSINADRIFLDYDYSNIFDEIYLAAKSGQKFQISKTKPKILKLGEGVYITKAKDATELKAQKINKLISKKRKKQISKKSRKVNRRKK